MWRLKLKKNILLLLALLPIAPVAESRGDQFPIESPNGDFRVEVRKDSQSGLNSLWVVSDTGSTQKRLYQYSRDANVVISPDGQSIAVNAHYSSTDSDILLFSRATGLNFEAVARMDLAELVKKLYQKSHRGDFPYDHWYVDCLSWSNNSKALLIRARGTGDVLSGWFCVFNLPTRQFSFDLRDLNGES